MTTTIALFLIISLFGVLTSVPQTETTVNGSTPSLQATAAPTTRTVHAAAVTPFTGVPDSLAAPAAQPRPAQAQQQVVMRINGETVDLTELRQIYHLNFVMDAFLSREADLTASAQLDQFLNSKLVTQAANQLGFPSSAAEADRALAQWLTAHGTTQAALQETLNANGFTIDDFAKHFQQLYRIDRYLSQQEISAGRTREALLQALQAQAQISFGAALDEFLATTPTLQQPAQAATQNALLSDGALSDAGEAEQAAAPFKQFPGLTAQDFIQNQHDLTSSGSVRDVAAMSTPTVGTFAPTGSAADSAESMPAPIGLAPGNRAPTFSLPALAAGQPERQLTDWYGTPIVLSFWTTWCPYCRKQTPVLVAANQLTSTAHIQFIGINVNESTAAVEPYIEEHAISYPILLDANGDVANLYAVRGYPTTYFLDADGLIVSKHVGALSEAELAQYLAQLTP